MVWYQLLVLVTAKRWYAFNSNNVLIIVGMLPFMVSRRIDYNKTVELCWFYLDIFGSATGQYILSAWEPTKETQNKIKYVHDFRVIFLYHISYLVQIRLVQNKYQTPESTSRVGHSLNVGYTACTHPTHLKRRSKCYFLKNVRNLVTFRNFWKAHNDSDQTVATKPYQIKI